MHFVTKIHPNLLPSKTGPAAMMRGRRSPQPIHLRQSDLDFACGAHCVFMALLVLRMVSRDWLTQGKPAANTGKLRIVRSRAARSFLLGAGVRDMARQLEPLRRHVTIQISEASHAAVLQFVLDNLSRERLVIAGITNPKYRLDHWVLAVGIAGMQGRDPMIAQQLLMLDSNHDPIPMLQWNAMLAVSAHRPRGRARLWTTSDGKVIPVTLHHALAVGRREPGKSR